MFSTRYPALSIRSNILAKVLIVVGLALAMLNPTIAEAGMSSSTISYSTSIENTFGITLLAGWGASVGISARASSTITITGPGGYSNTMSAPGEMILGEAGTYSVFDSNQMKFTGRLKTKFLRQ